MKILKTDSFVSERVKVKPITNAEWQQVKDEITGFRKIDNPTFDDIIEGNVVCCDYNQNNYAYIVFDYMKLPAFIESDAPTYYKPNGQMLLVRHNKFGGGRPLSYRSSYNFKEKFPYSRLDNTKITDIYDAKIKIADIQNINNFKQVYDSICEKIANYNKYK